MFLKPDQELTIPGWAQYGRGGMINPVHCQGLINKYFQGLKDRLMNRRVPDHALTAIDDLLARFELRFDQSDDIPAWPEQGLSGWKDLAQGYE